MEDVAAEQAHQEHGIWTTTNLKAAWNRAPDAVFVCTPPDSHVNLATAAIDHGAHVFVEKPLSDSVEAASKFVKRASTADVTVMVGCNMRFHPPVARINEWLSEDTIGRVERFRLRYGNRLSNWRSGNYEEYYSTDPDKGGGVILDAIHEIDIALEWLVAPDELQCVAGQYGDLELPVEDAAEVIIEGESQLGIVELDYLRHQRARTYELIGTNGLIEWTARGKDPEKSTLEMYTTDDDSWTRETYELTLNEMYISEIQHFIDCIQEDEPPLVDERKGRDALTAAVTAKTAADSGCQQCLDVADYMNSQ